jgi:hypothetical protein
MASQFTLLSQAAEWLYSLNPKLSKTPPRANDANEICYMGPDGTEVGVILCKDLLYSHATCVGSWLLPPSHHIVEGIVVTIISIVILTIVIPRLHKMTVLSTLEIRHPLGARPVSMFCFCLMMYYKYAGYPRRVFYLVMPCNMQWALSVIQCCILPTHWKRAQYTLLQMRLTYIMSVIIAIVTPETDDCILPGEFAFYWFNHALLLVLPAAYVINGSVSCSMVPWQSPGVSVWTFNMLWWAFSCALFSLFYFIPVTLLAIYSGLNLNFMMHPPHDHFALNGKWFRLVAVGMLAALFGVSRAMVYQMERAFRQSRSGADNNCKEKQR